MFIAAFVHNNQRVEAAQLSVDGRMDKKNMWLIHTMKYDLAFKRKVLHAKTWINFEDIMLSKISQPEKDKYYMLPFIWGTQSRVTETESRLVVARGWVGRREIGIID